MVPKAVLMKSGLVNTARHVNVAGSINTAHPKTTVIVAGPISYFSKTAHLTVKRLTQKKTTFKNSHINQRVNTVRGNVNIARPTTVLNAVKGNPQIDLQEKGVIDSGCSRYMTRNMSYLTDYKEIDGGYVAFGGNPKGGKIIGKEAVGTACYVQNRVLVVKPHNKTPYKLFHGRTPTLGFMKPIRCPVSILTIIDHLGKFDEKADERFFIGYSLNNKAFRVFNSRTRIVEEKLHIRFSKNTPKVAGSGPDWLFDIDALTRTMNYEPIFASIQSNGFADPKSSQDYGFKPSSDGGKKFDENPRQENECNDQEKENSVNNTNRVNTVSSAVNATGTNEVIDVGKNTSIKLPNDPNMPNLEDISIFKDSNVDEYVEVNAARHNLMLLGTTAKSKTINGEVQIHVLVDGKKVIMTESSGRRDLQLADEEGTDCLPNSSIFEQIALMKVTPLFPTMAVQNQVEMGEGSIIPIDPQHTPTFVTPPPQPKKTQKPRKPKIKNTKVPQPSGFTEIVTDKAVHEEWGDRLVMAATSASSLEAEQDNGNIFKTQSKATPNEPSSTRTSSRGGTRCQEAMGDIPAQTRSERRVLNLEDELNKTKTTQQNKIDSLEKRVKKLEKKNKLRTHKLKRLYKVDTTSKVESYDNNEDLGEDVSKQGGIDVIDADEDITLVSVNKEGIKVVEEEVVEVINTSKLIAEVISNAGEEVTTVNIPISAAASIVSAAEAIRIVKITRAPKVRRITIQEQEESTTTKILSSQQPQLDKELAVKLQAEINKEERLEKEKAQQEQEANADLINTWDDIQAKIDANHQLAEQLQAWEQEELTDAEKAKLFVEILEKKRKFFAAKRAKEKRNKPPTQAQQRNIMCNYLKNIKGLKLKDLKKIEFETLKKMFDKAFQRVNMFVDKDTKSVDEGKGEGSDKRAGEELMQEQAKKQKIDDDSKTTENVDDDNERAKLNKLMEIIPEEEEVALMLFLYLLGL
nr:ribonuclease H-like domain-containing protein [Tanacetum cinerariifolium]